MSESAEIHINPNPSGEQNSKITRVPRDTAETAKEIRLSGEEEIIAPNPRQQRKIISYLTSNNPSPDILGQNDVAVTTETYHDFLGDLRDGNVRQEKIDQMLMSIRTPLDMPADDKKWLGIVASLEGNPQGRAFLAHMSGKGMEQRDNLTPADIIKFIEANPLPSTLEEIYEKKFLDDLEQVNGENGPQKRSEYKNSIKHLKKDLYGKRMEYWDQVKSLRQHAGPKSKPELQASTTEHQSPTANNAYDSLHKVPEGMSVAEAMEERKKQNLRKQGYSV